VQHDAKRSGAPLTGSAQNEELRALAGLQRTTPLRCVLRCARETISKPMDKLSALFGRLFEALAALAALTLLAMVVLVTADIVLRNVARGGFVWANEISEYSLYLVTLLAAPWLLRRGQHIRLDLVLVMLPDRIAWLIEVAGDIVGFAISVILVRYGYAMAYDSWRLGSITIKNLIFPEWWLLAPLPATFLLLAVEFLLRFHRLMRDRRRRVEARAVG
jgi:TRAP-type C4-dicarboxylate transport system permease small subunit